MINDQSGLIFPNFWIFNWKQWHHLYTGIIMIIIGICWLPSIWGIIFIALGTWLTIDDIGQHRLQKVYNNTSYHSYGHYIGKPFFQLNRKYSWFK